MHYNFNGVLYKLHNKSFFVNVSNLFGLRASQYQDYLTKFGYLSRSNIETGELRSYNEIVKAVKNMQRMAGLPQTGDLDDPKLKELIGQPRYQDTSHHDVEINEGCIDA